MTFRGNQSFFTVGVLAAMALSAPHAARANQIFDVNMTIGSGSVIGTITTDGTIGTLAESDIVGVNVAINAPLGSAAATSTSDFYAFNAGDLSETDSELLFNFNGASTSGFTILSDDQSQAWTLGGGVFLVAICSSACDAGGTPGVEDDSRAYPVYYTELTGSVAIGTVPTTPEPGSIFLFSIGVAGIAVARRHRASKTN
jgi:hypothetical protein